jgi:DNA polymerase III subunit gamma/tau
MDQFVVSARKYRPATFNSVVGQMSITTTLKNAIKNNHLAQAFLFCGPRGVGKTTCARILAKTINCTNLTDEVEGCNQCESCISFNNGQSLNIFELDAASNNSVDDMRSLVEQVRYPPQSGKYKIYIIDEVHMLSNQAFNAFLKTLEEPPPYAIFILATTEKHKIIPTILSRCQIFDFNRITIDDIAKHLQWIADSEKVEAEPEALFLIAQKADGALRDALSIFDQTVSFAGNNVTYKHVIDNLNILDYEYYFKITDFLLAGDFSSALNLLNDLLNDGFDIHHFITGLAGHFRDLLVCKDSQTIALLEVGSKTKEKYKAQSQQCSASVLFNFLTICNRCDIDFKAALNQRLHVELALLKMSSINSELLLSNSGNGNISDSSVKKKVDNLTTPKQQNPNLIPAAIVEAKTPEVVISASTIEKKSEPVVDEFVAAEPPSPIPNQVRSRSTKTGTISITQKLSGKAIEEKSNDDELTAMINYGNTPLDAEKINKALQAFSEKLLQDGRRQLAVTLSKHIPVLSGESVVEILVDNAIQSAEIQDNKNELLTYMKTVLTNSSIIIQQRVVNETESKAIAYTPAEKFVKMAEKNPDLNILKQQFDLELDF